MDGSIRLAVTVAFASVVLGNAPAIGADYFFRAKPEAIAHVTAPLAASGPSTVSIEAGGTATPFSATGGMEPYSWSGSGMPAGVNISEAGEITAANAGEWSGLTALATDREGAEATVSFRLSVSAPLPGSLYGFGEANSFSLYPSGGTNQPVAVNVGGADFGQVTAAFRGACGIRDGDIWCWGSNGGILATGDTSAVTTGPKRVTSVAGGWKRLFGASYQHMCGLRNAGELWCWGRNNYGQVGHPDNGSSAVVPMRVGSASDWSVVAPGWGHTCAIKGAGELWCWGRNYWGQFGNGGTVDSSVPVRVGTSSAWTEVAGGGEHTCGIDAGTLKCWGYNGHGELGRGSATGNGAANWTPSAVAGDATGWSNLTSGWYHTCGIKAGEVHCWGENNNGKSGAGGTAPATTPRPIGSTGWTGVSAGYDYTCGIRGGELLCWGANQYGQSGGTGARANGPIAVSDTTGWRTVSAGYSTTFATR